MNERLRALQQQAAASPTSLAAQQAYINGLEHELKAAEGEVGGELRDGLLEVMGQYLPSDIEARAMRRVVYATLARTTPQKTQGDEMRERVRDWTDTPEMP